jgi:hypothetical protein
MLLHMDDITGGTIKKISFFEHVFDFKDDTKNDLLNLSQYSVLSIIPVIGLNKLMKHYIPDADDTKGSLEIVIELIAQVLVILIGLFYIHRIVTFVPTYSNDSYPPFQLINIVLVILFITLSLQTKLGEKGNILYERMMGLINGEESLREKEPVLQQNQNVSHVLPPPTIAREPMQNQQSLGSTPIQGGQNFDQMYQSNPTHMVNANAPGQQQQQMGPPPLMAANEALGGGGFGSMF